MSAFSADRNLLFGFLALQNGFISREDLIAAVSVWLEDKSRLLDEILRQRIALPDDEHALLAALVHKHLARHAGDAEQSLAAISSVGSIREELKRLGDAQLEASLAHLSASREAELSATVSFHHLASADGPRFRILRPHAKGGLGEVFVAEDTELHREVALKEIQSHHAGDQGSRARFVLEAEITGGLEHPGIVPIYGLGQYADGRPFYAMRFIKGDSLKEAVDRFYGRSRLPAGTHEAASDVDPPTGASGPGRQPGPTVEFRKLLGRFVDVCNAIEYAHSRGVLHRDLKPGNIMLGKYGETLVVDWGLAKCSRHAPRDETRANAQFDEATLRPSSASGSAPTQMGSVIGTPAYMSPEQAAGRLDQLGPASDVYSLGATLYYVLTGQAPFGKDDLGDLLRKVQAGQFPPPRAVRPAVPKALEAICLKAMALRPHDRYASPAALADEIEKWLADEPVAFYREPLPARAGRFMRHHRTLVAGTAAAVLVSLMSLAAIAAVVGQSNRTLAAKNQELDAKNHELNLTSSQLAKANTDLKSSNASERDAREEADQKRLDAEKARDETKQVLDYLVASFRKPDPSSDGEKLTVGELFEQAAAQLETSFPNQPLIHARLLNAIGETYHGLGLYAKAITVFERAKDLRSDELGIDHPDTLTSINNLAVAYDSAGRLSEALPLYEQTLELTKAKLGAEHPVTLRSMNNLAAAYQSAGRLSEALPLYEQTLELTKAKLGPEHPNTLTSMNNLAAAYQSAGRLSEALPLYEQTLELTKAKLGAEHPVTLGSMNNLAAAYQSAGRLSEALPLYEQTLELKKAKLGAEHPDTLGSMGNLASAYQSAGRLSEALPLYEQALELMKAKLGPEHPDTLTSMNNLASAYQSAGRLSEALPLYEQTLELSKAKLGAEHSVTLRSMNNLASAYQSAGRLAEALPLYEQALELMKAKLGAEHPQTLTSMNNLAVAYESAGRPAEALPLYEQTLELRKAKLGAEHPDTFTSMGNLAFAYHSAGRLPEALPLYEQTLELRRAKLGPEHPDTLRSMNNLASAYQSAGRLAEALPLYEQTLELTKAKLGAEHPHTLGSMGNLAGAYLLAERPVKALEMVEPFIAGHRRRAMAEDRDLSGLLAQVSVALLKHQQYAAADTYLRECLAIREQKLPDDWSLFNTKSMLGGALAGQKKFQEAEPLLVEGYQGMKEREAKIPPAGKVRLTEALQRLVDLYTAWDKPQEAAKWQAILNESTPNREQSAAKSNP